MGIFSWDQGLGEGPTLCIGPTLGACGVPLFQQSSGLPGQDPTQGTSQLQSPWDDCMTLAGGEGQ